MQQKKYLKKNSHRIISYLDIFPSQITSRLIDDTSKNDKFSERVATILNKSHISIILHFKKFNFFLSRHSGKCKEKLYTYSDQVIKWAECCTFCYGCLLS